MTRIALVVAMLSIILPFQVRGEDTHQTCVDVKVGSAQSYSCLNEQLATMARQQHRDSSITSVPYSATSPGNVTGQFNESATRNRLGDNFRKVGNA